MDVLTFRAVVTDENVLHPPADVVLPKGVMEVTVRPVASNGTATATATRNWLLELAKESELLAPNLPQDMAEQHDHYAHGKPRS
jgi:hypothetical protein